MIKVTYRVAPMLKLLINYVVIIKIQIILTLITMPYYFQCILLIIINSERSQTINKLYSIQL